MDWKPIQRTATEAADTLGHTLGRFTTRRTTPSVRSAMCDTCLGACWVGYTPSRGFSAGGRILKYRCGTREAKGAL